ISDAPSPFQADLRREALCDSRQSRAVQARWPAARKLCEALLRSLSTKRTTGSDRHAQRGGIWSDQSGLRSDQPNPLSAKLLLSRRHAVWKERCAISAG